MPEPFPEQSSGISLLVEPEGGGRVLVIVEERTAKGTATYWRWTAGRDERGWYLLAHPGIPVAYRCRYDTRGEALEALVRRFRDYLTALPPDW